MLKSAIILAMNLQEEAGKFLRSNILFAVNLEINKGNAAMRMKCLRTCWFWRKKNPACHPKWFEYMVRHLRSSHKRERLNEGRPMVIRTSCCKAGNEFNEE